MVGQVFPSYPVKASILTLVWLLAAPLSAFAQPIAPKKTVPTLSNTPSPAQTSGVSAERVPHPNQDTDYILGGGDGITVTVFQVPEFSGQYLILVDGTISAPLVGRVKLAGLTVSQASQLLSQLYTPYLKRPFVTVNVTTPRPLQIAVAGEVNSPGSYTLTPGGQTPLVTDLIREAGGLTTVADISQVQLRRVVNGKEKTWTLNLWELIQQGNLNQDLTVRDGDVIVVPTKENISEVETRQLSDANFGIRADQELNVAVVGEVYRPGAYKVTPQQVSVAAGSGTTAQSAKRQPPRLSLALQLAGGIKPLADLRQIEVRRFNRNTTQQTIKVDLWNLLATGDITQDIILQEGDTIVVPTASEVAPAESQTLAMASFAPLTIKVNVVGEVLRPGVVDVQPDTPLNQAIMTAGGFDKRRANRSEIVLIRLNPNGTVTKRKIPIDFAAGIAGENNPPLRNNDIVIVNRNGITATTDTLNTVLSPLGTISGFANFVNIFTGNN
ncbi:polysaccharide biosynthesis/export family protein [Gloeothece verrucosa]|uniref:Polysaccharide export protein n=1 Tax=Gloeothece verrucosa (strain PCC 7822) TaxID=497965 RepID=E0UAK4_GLOV7|nr:SLBB domain-containing protein [Gloeothece verrucosa]ADN12745.1 polysaccharide export protein [Gloeothece verrucosa PCC 7822]